MTTCNDNNNPLDVGSLSVGILTDEIKKTLQEVATCMENKDKLENINSVVFIDNNSNLVLLQSGQQKKPIMLSLGANDQAPALLHVIDIRNDGPNGTCCAYYTPHPNEGKGTIKLCENDGWQSYGGLYSYIVERSGDECCVFQGIVEEITIGGYTSTRVSNKRKFP